MSILLEHNKLHYALARWSRHGWCYEYSVVMTIGYCEHLLESRDFLEKNDTFARCLEILLVIVLVHDMSAYSGVLHSMTSIMWHTLFRYVYLCRWQRWLQCSVECHYDGRVYYYYYRVNNVIEACVTLHYAKVYDCQTITRVILCQYLRYVYYI